MASLQSLAAVVMRNGSHGSVKTYLDDSLAPQQKVILKGSFQDFPLEGHPEKPGGSVLQAKGNQTSKSIWQKVFFVGNGRALEASFLDKTILCTKHICRKS